MTLPAPTSFAAAAATAARGPVPRAARGADLLVHTLQRAGVTQIFTLSGNHIMPVYDALVGSGIRLVHVRHEAAAVHMADAWARLTGEVGVALVTGGPGHANALGALYTAALAEAPMLLLSGHAPLLQRGQGAFQEMAQAELAAPLCKPGGSWTCRSTQELVADVTRAWQLAVAGRPGPVHLSLPVDVLEAPLSDAGATAEPAMPAAQGPAAAAAPRRLVDPAPSSSASPSHLLPADAQRLLHWLAGAKRPLILAGPLALTQAGQVAARALQQATGVPVIGMESPRGVADPSLGAFAEVLARADALLLLGKRLDFTLRFGQPPALAAEARFAQIDPEDNEFERTRRAVGARLQLTACADALPAMRALLHVHTSGTTRAESIADAAHKPGNAAWADEVRQALDWRPASWAQATATQPGCLHPVQALAPLQALLASHPRSVLVCDGGEFGQWAQAVLQAPRRLINGVAGSIGSALPCAIAARLAEPVAPVVAVLGDGTAGFHLAEFDTALRCNAPFIAVIGNDARWNAEFQIQLREYGAARAIGCELLPTRYDLAAAGLGAHGELVTEAAQMPAALQRAVASGKPACINVMIEGLAAPTLTTRRLA